jgi:hypothetical protein
MSRRRDGFTLIGSDRARDPRTGRDPRHRALAALTDGESRLAAESIHWRNLDALFARIEADARAALPRDVRTGAEARTAWLGVVGTAGDAEHASPCRPRIFGRIRKRRTAPRLSPARRRDRGAHWPYLDQPAATAPQAYALAGGITRFRVSYLDERGAWRDRWPILGEPAIPRAIRVALTLASGEVVERWLALR